MDSADSVGTFLNDVIVSLVWYVRSLLYWCSASAAAPVTSAKYSARVLHYKNWPLRGSYSGLVCRPQADEGERLLLVVPYSELELG